MGFALGRGQRFVEFALDDLHDGGRGRAAKVTLELHPVPVEGIVAGSDDAAPGGAKSLHGARNCWSWSGVVRELHRNAGVAENFSGDPRGGFRGEPRVIA